MKSAPQLLLAIILIATCSLPAHAWLRLHYEDAQIVERSELIVVGSLKTDSLMIVPHPKPKYGGVSWETHAMLTIREVVKGELNEKEIPIVIRYGLDVSTGGENLNRGRFEKNTPLPKADKILLIDTGNSAFTFGPGWDLAQDNLWLLRKKTHRAQPTDTSFGIEDPEDVQPLTLRKYLECYLLPNPEPAIRAAIQTNPDIDSRALRYLQRSQVTRILEEKDPATRVERLLPYYQTGNEEAYRGIVDTGSVAGPYLMALYKNSPDERRDDIIRLWGHIRYTGCVDTLIELLNRQEQFWAAQKFNNDNWWNTDVSSQLTRTRRTNYSLVYASVYALSQILPNDPRAREALELTRRRWATINFSNKQILETCVKALETLPNPPPIGPALPPAK
ncbi:MAG: hypothetical protein FWD53_04570 [Phycisphaerales bacterium]|nr:hypothetical protein [Phycisphaerales bacterium]